MPTLSSALATSQVSVGSTSVPTSPPLELELIPPPLLQGSSTLFAVELMARSGLQRAPILNSERFLTGLITQSMLISLIGQYKNLAPAFSDIAVKNIMQVSCGANRRIRGEISSPAVAAQCAWLTRYLLGVLLCRLTVLLFYPSVPGSPPPGGGGGDGHRGACIRHVRERARQRRSSRQRWSEDEAGTEQHGRMSAEERLTEAISSPLCLYSAIRLTRAFAVRVPALTAPAAAVCSLP